MAVKYPAPSPPMIPARNKGKSGKNKPRAVVIHGTVSSDNPGTARNIANWWASSRSPMTSCHYIVDPREVIQCVGDHTVAYHCGSNQDTIGVELCDEQQGPASRWQDADSQAIIRRAARLVAELCLAYGIEPKRPTIAELKSKGKHGVYGHNDSRLAFGGTSHTDPRDFPWEQFLRLVRAEIAKIKAQASGIAKPAPVAPASKPVPEKFPPFYHTDNYLRGDSPQGLKDGRKKGFTSIDLDFHIAKDGSWVCVHWGDLRGLVHENGKKATGTVKDHTWSYLSKLGSQYGTLQTAWSMLHLAKKEGYSMVEIEVKDTPTVEQFRQLKNAADSAGIKIVVKRLTSIRGWGQALQNAHEAGIQTMALPRGTVSAPSRYRKYVDFVRQGGENKLLWV